MNLKSQKDLFSGLLFMVIGVAFAWGASDYTIGNAARMGPGYFPLVLGVLLALLGGGITFKALVVETVDGEKIGPIAWKPLCLVVGANLVFGAMLSGMHIVVGGHELLQLPPLGLIVGVYALTFIASAAAHAFKFVEVCVLATVLAVVSYLAFIVLLKLPLLVWPVFVTS
jgi:hypothetical protein